MKGSERGVGDFDEELVGVERFADPIDLFGVFRMSGIGQDLEQAVGWSGCRTRSSRSPAGQQKRGPKPSGAAVRDAERQRQFRAKQRAAQGQAKQNA